MANKSSKRSASKRLAASQRKRRAAPSPASRRRGQPELSEPTSAFVSEHEQAIAGILERRLPQLKSLSSKELLNVNLHVPRAVAQSLGVVPKVNALLPTLRQLITLDSELVASLEDWTLLLNHAHACVLGATRPARTPARLVAEAVLLRATLRQDAIALTRRGLVDKSALRRLSGETGFRNTARDLRTLAAIFTADWESLAGKCAVTETELALARTLAEQLLAADRGRSSQHDAAARELRARVFTMFSRAYAEARAGIAFIRRREGDLDLIIPPLHAGRSNSSKVRSTATKSSNSDNSSADSTGKPHEVDGSAPNTAAPVALSSNA